MRALVSAIRPRAAALVAGYLLLAIVLLFVCPAVLGTFQINLLARLVCYAVVAVGIGLAWGRGGMLTMGQGVFFGLGAYAMAMHLKLADAGPNGVPDFMSLYGDGHLPGWWEPFRSPVFTVAAAVLLPALVALVLGFAILKRRVKGAYFAILSQALAYAFALLLIGNIQSTGGTNGLNGFRSFFGYNLYVPANQVMIYTFAAVILLVALALMAWLYASRYGELLVAVRDAEERVRFLGYDPANVKIVAYVLSATLAGIAGAMFVPIAGIISPSAVGVVPSIAFITGVALGGRATLLGPAIGAIAVGWAQNQLSSSFPSFWTYFQGGLFIVVVALLPGGLGQLPALVGRLAGRTTARIRTSRPLPSRTESLPAEVGAHE
ncbi:MAG TPA: urea ABC transporter permease subunit UrtC [Nocardioides sp.]|nr:urea ABC transporter permease subunit UrtC [Nocardioides sp.]